MLIAVHPQSCSLRFVDFVQFYARNPSFNASLNPTCIQILPPNLYLLIQTIFNALKEFFQIWFHYVVQKNIKLINKWLWNTKSQALNWIKYFLLLRFENVWNQMLPNFILILSSSIHSTTKHVEHKQQLYKPQCLTCCKMISQFA